MITQKQDISDFHMHCKESYTFWKDLIPTQELVLLIFKEMLKFGKQDWLSLFLKRGYSLQYSNTEKKINSQQISQIHTIRLSLPKEMKLQEKSINRSRSSNLSSKSRILSESSESSFNPFNRKKYESYSDGKEETKGFKPSRLVQPGLTSDLDNLETNSKLFDKKILPILYQNTKNLSKSERNTCTEFFKQYKLTDEERKFVWRTRIGNKLEITRSVFKGLEVRLEIEKCSAKIEKLIIGDLDRTFPNCKSFKEGQEMYAKMQHVLRLFAIYRPDIGYIQGMTYLVSILYYYFDEFETFVLFSNLMVGNDFVYSMYTFEVEKVTYSEESILTYDLDTSIQPHIL